MLLKKQCVKNTHYKFRPTLKPQHNLLKAKKMTPRNELIKNFRGETLGEVSEQSSAEEVFQNQVLRPILKLQNELILAMFQNYLKQNKIDFDHLSLAHKLLSLENAIQKDVKFKHELKGIILGLFTLEEYQFYVLNATNLNKRIMTMLIERNKSQLIL